MALTFNKLKGTAQKGKVQSYTYVEGDNKVRMVGDVCARYVYWLKGENDKNVPFECLSFDREKETFTNMEKDWIREYYPDQKCTWSYAIQCIHGGEVKVLNLKKKLLEQILLAAEDLGDPADPETGWDVCFKRLKTGPMAYNVEYQLQPLKCKPRPLDEKEMELISELRSMDEVLARPTPDAQKELLDRIRAGSSNSDADESINDEFDI
ncbi:MAG: hypothetical protein CMI74_09050 [Candidatus Pelagibacter sp.]|nr:hypothetical protein [Candidatus Pelagibacter sp.]|tara:strand:- start:2486 stop:3112 length:627 start_codon:yes stop_codon:yes gene_type:complete